MESKPENPFTCSLILTDPCCFALWMRGRTMIIRESKWTVILKKTERATVLVLGGTPQFAKRATNETGTEKHLCTAQIKIVPNCERVNEPEPNETPYKDIGVNRSTVSFTAMHNFNRFIIIFHHLPVIWVSIQCIPTGLSFAYNLCQEDVFRCPFSCSLLCMLSVIHILLVSAHNSYLIDWKFICVAEVIDAKSG